MTWPQYKRRECSVPGRVVKLSRKESEIVLALLLARAPVSCGSLIEWLYPDDNEPDWAHESLEKSICRLRRKLGPRVILNTHSRGYSIGQSFSPQGACML